MKIQETNPIIIRGLAKDLGFLAISTGTLTARVVPGATFHLSLTFSEITGPMEVTATFGGKDQPVQYSEFFDPSVLSKIILEGEVDENDHPVSAEDLLNISPRMQEFLSTQARDTYVLETDNVMFKLRQSWQTGTRSWRPEGQEKLKEGQEEYARIIRKIRCLNALLKETSFGPGFSRNV